MANFIRSVLMSRNALCRASRDAIVACVGSVAIAVADAAGGVCRVLSVDANAEPFPHTNAVGFTDADTKSHVDSEHQRAARDCSRFERRIDQ